MSNGPPPAPPTNAERILAFEGFKSTVDARLANIESSQKRLEERILRAEKALLAASLALQNKTAPNGAIVPRVAAPAELDGEKGDPQILKDPPKWSGQTYARRKMSECPPNYLETFAGFKEWQAEKNQDDTDPKQQRYVKYNILDAALARGWAARKRADGEVDSPSVPRGSLPSSTTPAWMQAPAQAAPGWNEKEDEIPF